MKWDLLEKTTFWVEGIELDGAHLDEVADACVFALGMNKGEIMVVDVRPGLVGFDVLRREVEAARVAGKEKEILDSLARTPGVKLAPGAGVHSEGVLGLIALEEKYAGEVLAASKKMAQDIAGAVSKRAVVFASGAEVLAGKIVDTNSPFIIDALLKAGYRVKFGGVLEDDAQAAAAVLEGAAAEGYGLAVTTGGVGAEDKDFTVEAIERVSSQIHTPWILKFDKDFRRHHKEGVRIAVGRAGLTTLAALPGPHEEAKLGVKCLLEGMRAGLDVQHLAEHIAGALRERWKKFMRESGDHVDGLSRGGTGTD